MHFKRKCSYIKCQNLSTMELATFRYMCWVPPQRHNMCAYVYSPFHFVLLCSSLGLPTSTDLTQLHTKNKLVMTLHTSMIPKWALSTTHNIIMKLLLRPCVNIYTYMMQTNLMSPFLYHIILILALPYSVHSTSLCPRPLPYSRCQCLVQTPPLVRRLGRTGTPLPPAYEISFPCSWVLFDQPRRHGRLNHTWEYHA